MRRRYAERGPREGLEEGVFIAGPAALAALAVCCGHRPQRPSDALRGAWRQPGAPEDVAHAACPVRQVQSCAATSGHPGFLWHGGVIHFGQAAL